jgi:ribosomal peptide maturation radical SAM protein 1
MPDSLSILLLHMPWAITTRPSIPLGILTRLCQEQDVAVRAYYPNLDIAAGVGTDVATQFADDRFLFGLSEHLFAADIFGVEALESDAYLEEFAAALARNRRPDDAARLRFGDPSYLRSLRDDVVPRFLAALEQRVLDLGPWVVGFTATFNQVMSSLALAARLKRANRGIITIAGGSCFDGEMGLEYHRALPAMLDHVFIGEAEVPFRKFLRRLRSGEPASDIPGVTWQKNGQIHYVPGTPLSDMDRSPSPDYDDYFSECRRVCEATGIEIRVDSLPFESSRGCWWGQKNQCTFCGINPEILPFRAKSLDLVIAEIEMLCRRYGVLKLTATDWIMSRSHADELFRRLRALNLDLDIFYELRADMSKGQLKAMFDAGIVTVQAGIESLSTPMLKLMKKGTTAIRHIQFIRWAREIGVFISYNILVGFPDEDPRWYHEMTSLITRLAHLQPPADNVTLVEMHRFAPMHEQREQFGIDEHALRADYQHNFPPGMIDELKAGYFFDFHSARVPQERDYLVPLANALEPWVASFRAGKLPRYDFSVGPGFLKITDERGSPPKYIYLTDLHRDVVLLCDSVQSLRKLASDLAPKYGSAVSDGTLGRVVDELIARDVLLQEDQWLLTLPISHRPRTTHELRELVFGGVEVENTNSTDASRAINHS